MMDENYTNDLFGEQLPEGENGRKARLKGIPDQRFMPYIRIPMEYSIIIAIFVLILMIISFAAGVERGKAIVRKEGSSQQEKTMGVDDFASQGKVVTEARTKMSGDNNTSAFKDTELDDASLDMELPDIFEEEEKKTDERLKTEAQAKEKEKTKKAAEGKTQEKAQGKTVIEKGVYSIQLASSKQKFDAENEVKKLKSKGLSAQIVKKGDWYQIEVTGYKTKEEASLALKKFADKYKGCFVKKSK
ncbi:MAG: SPOR domain-containing protein [Candidatus Omnitrophica bacterium]|nr:SPOR domain-containing protein [Candidatus Omnitrophota bacterium]